MFKTTVTPQDTHLQISIPKSYVGKEVEIEVHVKKKAAKVKEVEKNGISQLRGKLKMTEKEQKDFDEYVKTGRAEWERPI